MIKPKEPAKVQIASGAEVPYVPPEPQPLPPAAGIWQQMTTEADNQTKDLGLVQGAWLGLIVLGAIPSIIGLALYAMWLDPLHKFDSFALGGAIGAICTGYGVALAALGAYRKLLAKP